eukprot:g41529.t1
MYLEITDAKHLGMAVAGLRHRGQTVESIGWQHSIAYSQWNYTEGHTRNGYGNSYTSMTPEQLQAWRWEREIDERNRPLTDEELDAMFPEGYKVEVDESTLSPEEQKERKIMKLLLKIKNGTPPMRKAALRQITDKAREFGAGPLFNQILPLLMSPTLEDQERHLLVKVIDRILYKLDDLVRPYVHK